MLHYLRECVDWKLKIFFFNRRSEHIFLDLLYIILQSSVTDFTLIHRNKVITGFFGGMIMPVEASDSHLIDINNS